MSVRLVRIRSDAIAKAGSPASDPLASLADDQTAADQLVELLADRVRVETQRVCKLGDPQWLRRLPQEGQQS